MSSLEDFNKARQEGTTVGHQWKAMSDNRDKIPPRDPFKEVIQGFSLEPFGKYGIEEWNHYLTLPANAPTHPNGTKSPETQADATGNSD